MGFDDKVFALTVAIVDTVLLLGLILLLAYVVALQCRDIYSMRRVIRSKLNLLFTARNFSTVVMVGFVAWQVLVLVFYYSFGTSKEDTFTNDDVHRYQLKSDLLATVSDFLTIFMCIGMALFLFVPRAPTAPAGARLTPSRSDLETTDFPLWVFKALDTTITLTTTLTFVLYIGLFTTDAYFICMAIDSQGFEMAFYIRKTVSYVINTTTFVGTAVGLAAILRCVGEVLKKKKRRRAAVLFWRVVVTGAATVAILLFRGLMDLSSLVYIWASPRPFFAVWHFGLLIFPLADGLANVLRYLLPVAVLLLLNKPRWLCSKVNHEKFVTYDAYVN